MAMTQAFRTAPAAQGLWAAREGPLGSVGRQGWSRKRRLLERKEAALGPEQKETGPEWKSAYNILPCLHACPDGSTKPSSRMAVAHSSSETHTLRNGQSGKACHGDKAMVVEAEAEAIRGVGGEDSRVPAPCSSRWLKRPALRKTLVVELGVADCVAAGTSFPPAAVFLWPPARSERLPIGVPLRVADRAGGRRSDRRVARGKLLLVDNWCRQPASCRQPLQRIVTTLMAKILRSIAQRPPSKLQTVTKGIEFVINLPSQESQIKCFSLHLQIKKIGGIHSILTNCILLPE
ncbi:hypothetical protein QTO34_002964 [Cnephaeus nilssonii]|uniref:Uncharacterized protein n=1 Tax=Cnephaeus nilssonii TaxID=3371016 RepID=A0AA40HT37_CNENI|nr:hypothetical protein QTO34_002964 [Eptesicus nilssonii]